MQVDAQDAARAQQLQGDIAGFSDRLEELSMSCAKLQAHAAALQARVDEVGGPALRQQRASMAQLQQVCPLASPALQKATGAARLLVAQDIAGAEAAVTKKQVQAASSRKMVVKLHRDAAKAEEQLDTVRQQISAQEKALTVRCCCCCCHCCWQRTAPFERAVS